MGTCLQGNIDSDSETITIANEDHNFIEMLDESDKTELTMYLIAGYIRNEAKYCILEINDLCIKFYGNYPQHLVYMRQHNNWYNWYSSQISDKVQQFPLTQYIDPMYQIVRIGRFYCINTETNQIHHIEGRVNKENQNMHLLITDLEPRHNSQSSSNKIVSITNRKECQLGFTRVWKKFENNLWDLFVINRLYEETQNMRDQQIWRVIQFIFMIYFDGKQGADRYKYEPLEILRIPTIILSPNYRPKSYFNRNKFIDGKLVKKDKYKSFDVNKDCNAEIMEYENGKILSCKCYLYIDWGAGRGCNQILYESTFHISRPNDKIEIKINFDVVQSYYKFVRLQYDDPHSIYNYI